ncbi:MAG: ABC transporter permease [Actinobacteria bacterium]|nr:ABC transporter permease [Actinomycetota bacterium]
MTVSVDPSLAEGKAKSGGASSAFLRLMQKNGLMLFFAVLLLIFAAVRPEFLSLPNLRNIAISAAVLGILAVGQTIVIITGGFDLSVARNAVAVSMVLALLVGLGPVVALLGAVATGMLIGLTNGVLISQTKVNPFVVTLGMYTILGSVVLLLNNGNAISQLPDWILNMAKAEFLGISSVVWWFVIVAIAGHLLLAHTKFGRHLYAVGGNPSAARVSGVRVKRVTALAYLVCGLAAAIGGIILTARLQIASPVALPGAELDAIAAVIIGGTRLSGGFGSIPRTILGVLILTSLSSGLVLMGVSSYWQGAFKGAIIILAVIFDVAFASRRR